MPDALEIIRALREEKRPQLNSTTLDKYAEARFFIDACDELERRILAARANP